MSMNGFVRASALCVALFALSVCADASVTAFTPASQGTAAHSNGLYSATLSAPLFAWDAPYTTSTFNGAFYETLGRLTTTIPISTPTHVRMEGDYFGFGGITTTQPFNLPFETSLVDAFGQLVFTVDTASVVTISSFNTAISVTGFGSGYGLTAGRLRFEGVQYTFNAVDAAFTFNVGPGTYTAEFQATTGGVVNQAVDPTAQWFAQQSQKFRIDVVSPVPAPGAAALLGLGGLMAARRRRA